jgi:ZIP family zinc transporter
LLSAVAYELIPESHLYRGVWLGVWFLMGALVYYAADLIVDRSGGESRQKIARHDGGGSGAALFLGTLLDGVPESLILGITLSLGGSIDVAFISAVFISNIPEGIAGTNNLRSAGYSDRHILWMWSALVVTCAVTSALGFNLASSAHLDGVYAEAFAGGAVLTMLANSMLPEAFEHGGTSVGLLVVLGYLVAAALTIA